MTDEPEPWYWDSYELDAPAKRRIARAVELGCDTESLARMYGVCARTIRRIAARERGKVVK